MLIYVTSAQKRKVERQGKQKGSSFIRSLIDKEK